jgi:Ca2+/Na+ antiporter
MDKKMSKILMVVVLALSVIGIILMAMVPSSLPPEEAPEYMTALADQSSAMGNYVGYALFLLYAVVGITIVLSLLNLFKKPAMLKRVMLSIGVLGLILIIAYAMADSSAVYDATGKVFPGSEGATSKWVGTGIIYSIILLIAGPYCLS